MPSFKMLTKGKKAILKQTRQGEILLLWYQILKLAISEIRGCIELESGDSRIL